MYAFDFSGTALVTSTTVIIDALIEFIKRKWGFGQTRKCKPQTQSIPDRRQPGSLYSINLIQYATPPAPLSSLN